MKLARWSGKGVGRPDLRPAGQRRSVADTVQTEAR